MLILKGRTMKYVYTIAILLVTTPVLAQQPAPPVLRPGNAPAMNVGPSQGAALQKALDGQYLMLLHDSLGARATSNVCNDELMQTKMELTKTKEALPKSEPAAPESN